MWIQNVSLQAVRDGDHFDAGDRAVLIQIVDPGMEFPQPKHAFEKVYQFEFLDVEKGDAIYEDFLMTSVQAEEIVAILKMALEERRNVVVHCHMGVCRSGAVAEVGVMMGFTDTEVYRQPNLWVKSELMRVLGWGYDDGNKVENKVKV